MKITYNELSVKATKTWTDANGKRHRKTKTFSQTVNPYNRDKNGTPKSRGQIYAELLKEREEWLDSEEADE
jgi:hypothetical protein